MHVSQGKKFWFFFPSLIIDRNFFSFCILYLKCLMGIEKKRYSPCSVKIRLFLLILWLGERKNTDISDFWVCELYRDKTVYYQRECFSREKGKKIHSVLLSLCRKCYWKLRVQGLPKFLEGHLVCFLFCVTISCGCRLSYAYVPCSFLMFEGALCYPPEMKMRKWNWAACWVVRWFSGQIRLFFFFSCWHFFFKVPFEIGCIAWTVC